MFIWPLSILYKPFDGVNYYNLKIFNKKKSKSSMGWAIAGAGKSGSLVLAELGSLINTDMNWFCSKSAMSLGSYYHKIIPRTRIVGGKWHCDCTNSLSYIITG